MPVVHPSFCPITFNLISNSKCFHLEPYADTCFVFIHQSDVSRLAKHNVTPGTHLPLLHLEHSHLNLIDLMVSLLILLNYNCLFCRCWEVCVGHPTVSTFVFPFKYAFCLIFLHSWQRTISQSWSLYSSFPHLLLVPCKSLLLFPCHNNTIVYLFTLF
jgi:hypothetical protein